MTKDMDQISRDKIRSDIRHNFFVEAGAGSGKTTVLVDRMAAMVEGGLDISKICAITYTKAAAYYIAYSYRNEVGYQKSKD